MNISDDDGFTYVTYQNKKKVKGRSVSSQKKNSQRKYESVKTFSTTCSEEIDKNKIKFLRDELEKSEFFIDFRKKLDDVLERLKSQKELCEQISTLSISGSEKSFDVICYGLGSFSTCVVARNQLAFLMALKNYLKTENVSLYDPVFTNEENACLSELGFNVISLNERGKRKVLQNCIFFMPHCDLPLYNNLLWCNWNLNCLSKFIIIGNSFMCYKRLPDFELKKRGNFIKMANDFVTEVKMSNNYLYKDVFNDMSIHYFENESLNKLPDDFWLAAQKPCYESDDFVNYS